MKDKAVVLYCNAGKNTGSVIAVSVNSAGEVTKPQIIEMTPLSENMQFHGVDVKKLDDNRILVALREEKGQSYKMAILNVK